MRCTKTLLTMLGVFAGLGCAGTFQASQAELQMTSYPAAPDAPAVTLERSGRVVFGYQAQTNDAATFKAFGKMQSSGQPTGAPVTPAGVQDSQTAPTAEKLKSSGVHTYTLEVRQRLKIFKDAGLARARIEEPIPAGARLEELSGRTFLPNGQSRDLDSAGVAIGNGKLAFNMPGAVKGAVLEYSYKIFCPDIAELKGWTFQDDIPVARSSFRIKMKSGTNLSFGFVKTADDQPTDPQTGRAMGMEGKNWQEMVWQLEKLPAVPAEGQRASLILAD